MASSALKSALRFTACMQVVNLKTKLLLRSAGRRRRSVGNCGATPGPRRFGRAVTSLSGLSNWPSAGGSGMAALNWHASPDLRNRVGKSLAMGHSPEQIAGRLALEQGRVIISHEFNLSFHLSSCGPEGSLASPAAAPETKTRASPAPRRQHRQPHQTTVPGHRTSRRGRRSRDAGSLGSRLHAVRPLRPRVVGSLRTTNPLQHRSSAQSIEKPSSPPGPSAANLANCRSRCARQSASTTETSSPNIIDFTKPSAFRPSSAIRIARGKKVAWKTPSGACDGYCPAKPTSRPSHQPPSNTSFNASTTPHANAGLQDTRRGILQTQINRCTSNVTPSPAFAGYDGRMEADPENGRIANSPP